MKDFEFIATHKPANQTSKNVLSKGVCYEYTCKSHCRVTSDLPIEIIKFENIKFKHKKCEDLTGKKCGRLTVIGISKQKPVATSLWVVRCVCGNYEKRRAKSIKNPLNKGDCCQECNELFSIKRHAEWVRTGQRASNDR
jgi:hypothetical protein